MLYLSKGMILKQCKQQEIRVTFCGVDYLLTGIGAHLWLGGRFGINEAEDEREIRHLAELQRLGLAELSEDISPLAIYRLLTRCIICPAVSFAIRRPLTSMENQSWQWISKAGLRLTIGELTKLFSEGVSPSPDLLGKENAQELTLRIYANDLGFDTTPDIQMEQAANRDDVVNAVLGLLQKKRIILI